MTSKHTRERAAHLLALAASGCGETLAEIAAATGLVNANAVLLARRMLVKSLGVGSWRDVRGEAEAKLRCAARRQR